MHAFDGEADYNEAARLEVCSHEPPLHGFVPLFRIDYCHLNLSVGLEQRHVDIYCSRVGILNSNFPDALHSASHIAHINISHLGATPSQVSEGALELFVVQHQLHRDQQVVIKLEQHQLNRDWTFKRRIGLQMLQPKQIALLIGVYVVSGIAQPTNFELRLVDDHSSQLQRKVQAVLGREKCFFNLLDLASLFAVNVDESLLEAVQGAVYFSIMEFSLYIEAGACRGR